MALKDIAKIYPNGKAALIYIPSSIATDSQFPLPRVTGARVKIEIREQSIIIKKE